VLAYLYLMLTKAKEKNISIHKETFVKYGEHITFFDGVESYFERMNEYAKSKKLNLEHYIISSGLREFVQGTSIARHFKNIFASGFQYDAKGIACWPALAVNYTNKTQFLFRINKGIHNSYDNTLINKIVQEEDKPVPFSNIIYIGDGETDIPAMKMVKLQGGISIAVYNPNAKPTAKRIHTPKDICLDIVRHNRADYIAPADYTENSQLDVIIKKVIDKIAMEQDLIEMKNEIIGEQ
ncbi:MAG: haloacid dehalogenase-like hydrolase, partial [Bacteroidales bacterium]